MKNKNDFKSKTDPQGSYTGSNIIDINDPPIQDADEL